MGKSEFDAFEQSTTEDVYIFEDQFTENDDRFREFYGSGELEGFHAGITAYDVQQVFFDNMGNETETSVFNSQVIGISAGGATSRFDVMDGLGILNPERKQHVIGLEWRLTDIRQAVKASAGVLIHEARSHITYAKQGLQGSQMHDRWYNGTGDGPSDEQQMQQQLDAVPR